MSNKIAFNTGRGYTDKGQRIAATQLDCGRVFFVDIDRGITYATAAPCDLTQRDVMTAYDYNDTISEMTAIPDFDARRQLTAELEALAATI